MHYFVVPNVALIQILLTKLVGVVLPGLKLELDLELPLKVAGDVSMIAVVEALLFEDLLDAKYILLNIGRHLIKVLHILIKRNHINALDEVYKVSRWHPCHELPVLHQNEKQVAGNVHDSDYSMRRQLPDTFLVLGLAF